MSFFSIPSRCIFLILTILCLEVSHVSAQHYSLAIERSTLQVDSMKLMGYRTTFSQPSAEVKKAWWKYIKAKAVIFNKVSHYELKFPGENGTKDVYAVSVFEAYDSIGVSHLSVAIRSDSIDTEDFPKLDQNLKALLLDFKTSYFTGILQDQIKDQEKKAAKLSAKIEKQRSGKNKDELTDAQIKAKENGFLYSLNQIEQNLDSLKLQLREIK